MRAGTQIAIPGIGGPRAAFAGLILVAGLAGGCATPPAAPMPRMDLVWPAPPEPPRIAYVHSIRTPADLGIRRSGFGRFIAWVTGSGREDRLVKPFGVALDEQDNLCVTDTGARAVFYFDRARLKWRRWDEVGGQRFLTPVAAAKRNGTFFVADSGLRAVLAFDEEGRLQRQITNRLERPSGLALAGEHLLVADALRHRVLRFDLDGNFVSEFGRRGEEPGEFNFPTHVAADAQGRVYVTDSLNGRIQVFDAQDRFQTTIGGLGDAVGFFSRPKGVAADTHAHVYAVDANFDNIQVFDQQGRILLAFGGAGSEPGQFWLPGGLAIGRDDTLYVADSYNRRVQVFKYVGQP